ncbi:RTA1 like protein [Aspergillus sclerotioniger CBS 115572]|uniref:RTA1 like protein n=1 Tax=Aspergillus sclerotioniger CBS 115572 TaxID=1450535 RepID=A0A317XFR4_9EURO|nr:RTA1 like protein [Aspergillus sclerotioniger CBS 115572]PWY95620.1 RTA1 like protein [Aspergillus sclerotioniger CBS 115572]
MSDTFVLYRYDPSYAAAVVFAIGFLLTALGHIWQTVQSGSRSMTPFIIGIAFETLGYISRAINAKQTPNWSIAPYAGQNLLLLLGPSLLAASVYMILGRIIRLVDGDTRAPIRPGRLTKIFVTGDVLSFLFQSGGGGILAQAKEPSKVKLGERMINIGLFVQILFFGVFIIVSYIFHRNIRNRPTERSISLAVPWERLLFVLYAVSALIMVRSIYRLAEYIQGSSGSLQGHEVYIYVFDATLMLLGCLTLNVFHPSQALREKGFYESEMA